jgi:protocatechuate 3,4-dioxygenase alpha subunit
VDLVPLPSQTVGPFFHLGCTETQSVSRLAGPNARGERVRLTVRVLDGDGCLVNDAMIEVWQANAEGKYHHPDDPQDKAIDPDFRGFGRLATDDKGTCVFETIKPGRVPGNSGGLQAPHLNVSIFGRGILQRLPTRIYFAVEAANSEDPILALVPEERRNTLMAHSDLHHTGHWHFDVHLSGKDETVFFDV